MDLFNKIDQAIELRRMKYGIMGTEPASITLELTEEELREFYTLEFDEHYTWEFEGNVLSITYVEEV